MTPFTDPCGLEARLHDDINAIDPAEWDSLLAPDDLQSSHRFVRLCQESRIEDADHWHLMVYQQGRLCAIASLCRMHVRLDLLATGLVRSAIRFVRLAWPGFLRIPVLFAGLPVSFGQPCLAIAPGADSAAVLGLLAGVLETLARQTRTRLLCLKEFDPAGAEALVPLAEHDYFRAASLPFWTLPLSWDSFPAYVAAMTAGYRRQLRATLQAREAAGLEVRRVAAFAAHGETIHALYRQVIERAEHRLEALNRTFLDRLDTDFGERSKAIFIERGGQTLAVAILGFAPGVTTFLVAGLDYRAPPSWQVYPNLVLEVVREAIDSGASRLELGQTSGALKGRLGGLPVQRSIYLRHRRPSIHWLLRRSARRPFPEQEYPPRRVFRDRPGGTS